MKGKNRVETASRIFPRLSRRFIWSKVQENLAVTTITFLPKILNRGAVFRRLKLIASKKKLPFHISHNITSDESLSFIRKQNPDVIVTLCHQFITSKIIETARLGVINIHPGILPNFRGIQPYFWELMEGFGKGGATLHFINDETIDTGDIIAQGSFKTTPKMSVQLNYYLTTLCAAKILPLTISRLENNQLNLVKQNLEIGAYYRWPDSNSLERLSKLGHSIINWRQLFGILTGKFDNFEPEEIII